MKISQYCNIFILFFTIMMMTSCRVTDYGEVPTVAGFDVVYDLYLTSNTDLLTVNGSIYDPNVGYAGIIVYRVKDEGLPDDFVAFECACPHDAVSHDGVVGWERWGVTAKCGSCGSEFLLLYGGEGLPIDGNQPTDIPLRQYETYFDGRFVTVSNK